MKTRSEKQGSQLELGNQEQVDQEAKGPGHRLSSTSHGEVRSRTQGSRLKSLADMEHTAIVGQDQDVGNLITQLNYEPEDSSQRTDIWTRLWSTMAK